MRLGRSDRVWERYSLVCQCLQNKKTKEELAAAGFYATGADTEYKIYAARNLPDRDSSDEKKNRFSQDHMMENGFK